MASMSKAITIDKSLVEGDLWKLELMNPKDKNVITRGPEAWRQSMIAVCMLHFPKVGRVLKDLEELEEPEPPERPDPNDPFEMEEYRIDLKTYKETRKQIKDQSEQMVAYLAAHIHIDVRARCNISYPGYDTEGDIIKTYNAIKEAALCTGTRDEYREKKDCDRARIKFCESGHERYSTIESLFEGYKHEVLFPWTQAGMEPLPPLDQVKDVVEALPPDLRDYRKARENALTDALNMPTRTHEQTVAREQAIAAAYPENLTALFNIVSQYKITVQSNGKSITENFATIQAMQLGEVNFVTERSDAWKRKPLVDSTHKRSEPNSSKTPPSPCDCCGQRYGKDAENKENWHWRQDCPIFHLRVNEKEQAEQAEQADGETQKSKPTKGEKKREKALATIAVKLGDASITYATIESKPVAADIPESWRNIKEYTENYAACHPDPSTLHFFDTCSNVSMTCNEKFLTNIRSGDSSIAVKTGGGVYLADQVGDSMFEGTVIYNPACPGNIGCADELQRRYEVTAVKQEIAPGHFIIAAYVMHLPQYSRDIVYRREGKVYVADLQSLYEEFPDFAKYEAPKPVEVPTAVTTADIERALGRKLCTIESTTGAEPTVTRHSPEDGVPISEIESFADKRSKRVAKIIVPVPINAEIAARREGVGVHNHKFFKRYVDPPDPPPMDDVANAGRDPDG